MQQCCNYCNEMTFMAQQDILNPARKHRHLMQDRFPARYAAGDAMSTRVSSLRRAILMQYEGYAVSGFHLIVLEPVFLTGAKLCR